jgi:predicted nucleic acid-binding protein
VSMQLSTARRWMSPVTPEAPIGRLFLDTGVIIEGCVQPWGASKAVLILTTQRERVTVVLAEAVKSEVQGAVARKIASLSPSEAHAVEAAVNGWFSRVRLEQWPLPAPEDIQQHRPTLLPVLRHINDLAAVVTAVQAKPDWVISGNRAHWNDALATRTGLRIVSPQELLRRLSPH